MADLLSPDYYRQREWQSRLLADRATLPEVKRIHEELAANYVRLAREAERCRPDRTLLRIVSEPTPRER